MPLMDAEETTISTKRDLYAPQAIFIFIFPALLGLLQIKYQGIVKSPFVTHPKTMELAISSFFISCFSFYARLRISAGLPSSPRKNIYYCFVQSITFIFGLISVTSLLSFLVPVPVCSLLVSLWVLIAISRLLLSQIKRMWKKLQAVIMSRYTNQPRTAAATTTTEATDHVSDHDHIRKCTEVVEMTGAATSCLAEK